MFGPERKNKYFLQLLIKGVTTLTYENGGGGGVRKEACVGYWSGTVVMDFVSFFNLSTILEGYISLQPNLLAVIRRMRRSVMAASTEVPNLIKILTLYHFFLAFALLLLVLLTVPPIQWCCYADSTILMVEKTC